jgi:mannosyltransferase OCH1-like enzyme
LIVRKIHFCWFGGKEKPVLVKNCIRSWESVLPDYEIVEWNEENTYDLNKCSFFKNAIRKKQYAFASDYTRFVVLYRFGGIYLDTDMFVIKSFDNLLSKSLFFGFELWGEKKQGNFAIIGSIVNNDLLKEFIDYYEKINFNEFHLPIITQLFNTSIDKLKLHSEVFIGEPDVFYPFPYGEDISLFRNYIKEETLCVHLWNHSWKKPGNSFSQKYRKKKVIIADFLFHGYDFNYLKDGLNLMKPFNRLKKHWRVFCKIFILR